MIRNGPDYVGSLVQSVGIVDIFGLDAIKAICQVYETVSGHRCVQHRERETSIRARTSAAKLRLLVFARCVIVLSIAGSNPICTLGRV